MKDHEIRELVNQLRDVAIKYHGTGQLREQIARTVRAAILQAQSNDDGEPTDDERIMAIEGIHNCEQCGDEGWVVGEMGITRCACGQVGNSPAQHADRPVAWHHTAKCKDENHSTCCFSYSPTHDFGPWYEKPQSQPHYLPERLDYDRALHFLSTEPRKLTEETLTAGITPIIPDGYVMVPKEATLEMIKSGASAASNGMLIPGIYKAMLAAADCSIPMISDRWIPVNERMPESNGVYFGWDGKRVLEVNCFFGGFSANQFIHGEITNWMPLPAPPTEVK
ncbi:TPA: DUF551 domain-containing protein [Klebsiella pneumoniae]